MKPNMLYPLKVSIVSNLLRFFSCDKFLRTRKIEVNKYNLKCFEHRTMFVS